MTKEEKANLWREVADKLETLLPHLEYAERFWPSITIDACRSNAKKLVK